MPVTIRGGTRDRPGRVRLQHMPVNAQVIQTMTDWLITLTAPARSIPGVCLMRNQLWCGMGHQLGYFEDKLV